LAQAIGVLGYIVLHAAGYAHNQTLRPARPLGAGQLASGPVADRRPAGCLIGPIAVVAAE